MKAVMAVDIGGTDTKLGLVQEDGGVLLAQRIPTLGPTPSLFLNSLNVRLLMLQEEAQSLGHAISGLGVSVAGFVDERGLVYNPNLEWLEGFDLRASLHGGVGFDPVLESDSNAACAAEFAFGAGHGASRFLCITLGTGVGVGMMVDGQLMRTAHGCLGDAGHVVVDPKGPACSCGGWGCAEAVIGAAAVVARSGLAAEATVRDVIAAARTGNAAASSALRQTGVSLGIALASLGQIFYPDCIAVAGGLAEAGELLLTPAEASFRHYAAEAVRRNTTVVKARMGWLAGLVGAAVPRFYNP